MKHPIFLILAVLTLSAGACRSIPPGTAGEDADALAEKMLAAIGYDAWQNKTAAVRWTFRGDHKHFWDRKRGYVQVEWDDHRVLFNKNTMQGLVYVDGKRVTDAGHAAADIAQANAYFVNDAFWLNPLFHIRSPGVKLSVTKPGSLRVDFTSGGVTPGDTYVFHTNAEGLVTEMQLWVDIVPAIFAGSGATFENYAESETGVKSARKYEYLVTITIDDLKMYAKYPPKGEDDVFAALEAE